jgi:hypothetical protein
MAKLFQEVLNENKEVTSKQAMDWLRKHVMEMSKLTTGNAKNFINEASSTDRFQRITENSIGKMYMFSYDPKMKEVLPYYDSYPLVFPIEFYGDSFLGMNLHYIPPALRARLMDALMRNINNKKNDKTTKLVISYNLLNGASRYKYFKPCVKKYLFSHVRSPFVYIAPDEWNIAMMLPTDRFVGASRTQVYKDSQAMVR